jgi:hypothetical protein
MKVFQSIFEIPNYFVSANLAELIYVKHGLSLAELHAHLGKRDEYPMYAIYQALDY